MPLKPDRLLVLWAMYVSISVTLSWVPVTQLGFPIYIGFHDFTWYVSTASFRNHPMCLRTWTTRIHDTRDSADTDVIFSGSNPRQSYQQLLISLRYEIFLFRYAFASVHFPLLSSPYTFWPRTYCLVYAESSSRLTINFWTSWLGPSWLRCVLSVPCAPICLNGWHWRHRFAFRVCREILKSKYSQKPQLSSSHPIVSHAT